VFFEVYEASGHIASSTHRTIERSVGKAKRVIDRRPR
jgi:hypothetical protein